MFDNEFPNPEAPRAVILGAGPAGLTAAYELVTRTNLRPLVLEMSSYMGGISRTIDYKGNRIDIGGHRFFSKSDRVMAWWLHFLPLEPIAQASVPITYRNKTRKLVPNEAMADSNSIDRVMLVRRRLSRIYFSRRFFSYPISLSAETIGNFGVLRSCLIGLSYLHAVCFPIRPEKNLEDFMINRFGRQLYLMFFKSYTEKVWGIPCDRISAEWGAQRIKGLSVKKALVHFVKNLIPKRPSTGSHTDVAQKNLETSLIERFLYPKFGPGQMWDQVACKIKARGGCVETGWRVIGLDHDGKRVTAATAEHVDTAERRRITGEYFFSTIPVRELVEGLAPPAPAEVLRIAEGLVYRDFIMVGLLCRKLRLTRGPDGAPVEDNWIYIQDPDVLVGRLQIFNNWSPYMVADPNTTWIGLEYFCFETDEIWSKTDAETIDLAKSEMERIGVVDSDDVLDGTVIRMRKTYPAYFGTYPEFPRIVDYMEEFDNLFLIGRNGMHKYNNQDHSMLAAMTAVDNIVAGIRSRENLWLLNTEQDFHEEK
ncbi:MAG TPA: NAD(P)/FAD-dependent oxidoreductase [Bryobacteraceae bacterium]|jgi:protoporphyrinogen oxidase|nr:NAD(P)/FAD-dependent oxidoreductase [Bryobacteraceae bacterium]